MDSYLYDIFEQLPAQGPGSREYTKRAFNCVRENGLVINPLILDLGCGTGRQTSDLARFTKGRIIAVDLHYSFVQTLHKRISPTIGDLSIFGMAADMLQPPFTENQFDLIWSEGAIYLAGFEFGLLQWKKLLKPAGHLAVTEVCWLREDAPKDVRRFWKNEYPDIKTARENLLIIENLGYRVLDFFPLPAEAWWENYYTPLERVIRNEQGMRTSDPGKMELLTDLQREIDLFRKYSDYYGYYFFVVQKED